VFAGQAGAVDLSTIPRQIAKEPAYRAAPRYSLLVFGPTAQTRVWLVFDGDALYIDRNGNGDLTEPDERVVSPNSNYYTLGDIREKDGEAVHRGLGVIRYEDTRCRLWITSHRLGRQYVGSQLADKTHFSTSPATAPIVHFDGPIVMTQYSTTRVLPRGTSGSTRIRSLRVAIGTPGLGTGTFAACDCECREKFGNMQVELRFPLDKEGRRFLVEHTDCNSLD
jgi:hypothetical protein